MLIRMEYSTVRAEDMFHKLNQPYFHLLSSSFHFLFLRRIFQLRKGIYETMFSAVFVAYLFLINVMLLS